MSDMINVAFNFLTDARVKRLIWKILDANLPNTFLQSNRLIWSVRIFTSSNKHILFKGFESFLIERHAC